MNLKGVLALDSDARRDALSALIPEGRDFSGKIVADQSFLLQPYVPPLKGVVEHFALLDERQAAEAEFEHYSSHRVCDPQAVLAELVKRFESVRTDAVRLLTRSISSAGLLALYSGKPADLNLLQSVPMPLAALYGSFFDEKALAEVVRAAQPSGCEVIDDETFSVGMESRRKSLVEIRSNFEALEKTPGRFDDQGRDLWLCHTAALLWWNERAIRPCDSAGRAAKNSALLAFLDALHFTNASEDFRDEWFTPTAETQMYRKPGGGYFLNWRASQSA